MIQISKRKFKGVLKKTNFNKKIILWPFELCLLRLSVTVIAVCLLVTPMAAKEYLLRETLESGKADICLLDLLADPQALSFDEKAALSAFCPLPLPKKNLRLRAAELEIFFYQAGLYPATIRSDVMVIPRLRQLSEKELRRWGIPHQNLTAPSEADIIAYQPPHGRQLELRLVGRGGRLHTWETIARPAVVRLPSGAPVTLRWENAAISIEIQGRLAHAARLGEKVTLNAAGRNFRGILVDTQTVIPEEP